MQTVAHLDVAATVDKLDEGALPGSCAAHHGNDEPVLGALRLDLRLVCPASLALPNRALFPPSILVCRFPDFVICFCVLVGERVPPGIVCFGFLPA